MGRKTWQLIGKPLPGRPNLVITRDAAFKAEGAEVVATLAAALERAQEIGRAHVCTTVTNAQLVCRLLLENNTPICQNIMHDALGEESARLQQLHGNAQVQK